MPMTQLAYPDLRTEEGLAIARTLPRITAAKREWVAREQFFQLHRRREVIPLPIPRGLDPDSCAYYCGGAVRYVEAYSVTHDVHVGRMDLCVHAD